MGGAEGARKQAPVKGGVRAPPPTQNGAGGGGRGKKSSAGGGDAAPGHSTELGPSVVAAAGWRYLHQFYRVFDNAMAEEGEASMVLTDLERDVLLGGIYQVSTVFIQLSSFHTSATEETLDLELLNTAYCALVEECTAFLGLVDILLADDKGFVFKAVFGLTNLYDDFEFRACAFALKVTGRLRRLGVDCRAGVASGKAFCGIVEGGSGQWAGFTMLGSQGVTLSARLMMKSLPNRVLVSESVFEKSDGVVQFEETTVTLKGLGDATVYYANNRRSFVGPGGINPGMVMRNSMEDMFRDRVDRLDGSVDGSVDGSADGSVDGGDIDVPPVWEDVDMWKDMGLGSRSVRDLVDGDPEDPFADRPDLDLPTFPSLERMGSLGPHSARGSSVSRELPFALGKIDTVGREAVLGTLDDAVGSLGLGVFIIGEVGMGKTHLLEYAKDEAIKKNRKVLMCRALSVDSSIPHSLTKQLVGELLVILGGMDAAVATMPAAMASSVTATLCELLPELARTAPLRAQVARKSGWGVGTVGSNLLNLVGGRAPAAEPEPDFDESICTCLERLVVLCAPAVITIESMHNADSASTSVLRSFFERCRWSMSLIMTGRPETLKDPPVQDWLTADGSSSLHVADLEPLSVEDSKKLLASLVPDASDISMDQEARLSGGLPLYLVEVSASIRKLAERQKFMRSGSQNVSAMSERKGNGPGFRSELNASRVTFELIGGESDDDEGSRGQRASQARSDKSDTVATSDSSNVRAVDVYKVSTTSSDDEAGGNTFLEEHLRMPVYRAKKSKSFTARTQKFTRTRLQKVKPRHMIVLKCAACVQSSFSTRDVVFCSPGMDQVTDQSYLRQKCADVHAMLMDMVNERLIVIVRNAPDEFDSLMEFASALVADFLYNSMVGNKRRAIHLAYARYLEAKFLRGQVGVEKAFLAMHWRRGGAPETAMAMYLSSARSSLEAGFVIEGIGLHRSALSCAGEAGVPPLVQAEIAAVLAGHLAFGAMDFKRAFTFAARSAKALGVPLPDFKVKEKHVWRLGFALNMGAFSWVDRRAALEGKSKQWCEIAVYCWTIMSLALTLPVTNATNIATSRGQSLDTFRSYVLLTTACMAPATSGTMVFTLANSVLASLFPLGRWVVARTGLAQARQNLTDIEAADIAAQTGVWTPYLRDKHESTQLTSRLASRIPLTFNFVSAFLCSCEGYLAAYEGNTSGALAKWETSQSMFGEQRGQAIWASLVMCDRLALLLDLQGGGGGVEGVDALVDKWDQDVAPHLPPGFTRFLFTTLTKAFRYCLTAFAGDGDHLAGPDVLDQILAGLQTSEYCLPAWWQMWFNCVVMHKHVSRIRSTPAPHQGSVAAYLSLGKQVIEAITGPGIPMNDFLHRSRLNYLPMVASAVLRLMYMRQPGDDEAVSMRDALDIASAREAEESRRRSLARSDPWERGSRTSSLYSDGTWDTSGGPTDIRRVDVAAALQVLREVAAEGAKCLPFMALRCGIVSSLVAEACLDVGLGDAVGTLDAGVARDAELRSSSTQLQASSNGPAAKEQGLYALEVDYHRARLLGDEEGEAAAFGEVVQAIERCPSSRLFSCLYLHNIKPDVFLQPDPLPDKVPKKGGGCCG